MSGFPGFHQQVLGALIGANMNTTADQAVPIAVGASGQWYLVNGIWVTNASASLTLAAGGIYPATGKAGTPLVAATQIYSALAAAGIALALTLGATLRLNAANLYLSLTTAQGTAATADFYLVGVPLAQ